MPWAIKGIFGYATAINDAIYELAPPFEVPEGTRPYRSTRFRMTERGRVKVAEKLLVYETEAEAKAEYDLECELVQLASFSQREKMPELDLNWNYLSYFFDNKAQLLFPKERFVRDPKEWLRIDKAVQWIREHMEEILLAQLPDEMAIEVRWRRSRSEPPKKSLAHIAREETNAEIEEFGKPVPRPRGVPPPPAYSVQPSPETMGPELDFYQNLAESWKEVQKNPHPKHSEKWGVPMPRVLRPKWAGTKKGRRK